jgi:hypothetical protein
MQSMSDQTGERALVGAASLLALRAGVVAHLASTPPRPSCSWNVADNTSDDCSHSRDVPPSNCLIEVPQQILCWDAWPGRVSDEVSPAKVQGCGRSPWPLLLTTQHSRSVRCVASVSAGLSGFVSKKASDRFQEGKFSSPRWHGGDEIESCLCVDNRPMSSCGVWPTKQTNPPLQCQLCMRQVRST